MTQALNDVDREFAEKMLGALNDQDLSSLTRRLRKEYVRQVRDEGVQLDPALLHAVDAQLRG